MPESIQAVIFDSDGTLVDTERLSITVLCEELARNDIHVVLAEAVEKWPGRDLHEILRRVQETQQKTVPDDFLDQFRERQLAKLATDVKAIKGADKLLSAIQIPKCVASNAPIVKVELCLRTTSLLSHFSKQHIFSAYQVNRWKPDPAVFLYAAKELGVEPANCAVVEDSQAGVQAAISAGMHVFAYDPERKLKVNSDVTVASCLTELIPRLGKF